MAGHVAYTAPDPAVNPTAYLRSIYAVRERTRLVLDKAKQNKLQHFECDMTKFPRAADYVVSIIKVLPFQHPQLPVATGSHDLHVERLCA